MAKTNDFEHLPCPHCGKKGLKWDFAAAQARCPHCHLSGLPTDKATPPSTPTPEAKEKPKPITNSDIERQARNSGLMEKVTETYQRVRQNGQPEAVKVERLIPQVPDDKIPDLSISYPTAMFHRHRLRALISQEKRWGRDDLRKRGFEKVGRMLNTETGKVLPMIAKPGAEDAYGSGDYALGQAIATVNRAEQKLKGGNGDKSEPRDD